MSDDEPPFPDEQPEQNPAIIRPDPAKPAKRVGNYVNANYELVELTDEQKIFVGANWTKMDLKELTQRAFNNPNLNGHHKEGKSVRAYIATLGSTPAEIPKPKTTATPKRGKYELAPEQKVNIEAILNQDEPPAPKEIFKLIFPDLKEYSYLGAEYQAVCRFIKDTNEEAIDIWEEPVTERRYKPPGSWSILLGIVNKCVGNRHDLNKALYDPAKMKASEERHIKALFNHMKVDTFVNRASRYERKMDRDTFISTFVRNIQDKAYDLIPEEVDAYMDLAAETVQAGQIDREIQMQQKLLSEAFEGSDEDGSKSKASMSLVESTNNLRDKLKESKNRVDKLRKDLAGSRKDRIDSRKTKDDHLGNWFALWVEQKTRKDLIELGRKEHAEDVVEYGRIKSMDDSWALIAGMTESEAAGGLE